MKGGATMNDGGSIWPDMSYQRDAQDYPSSAVAQPGSGMSLRDWFAGQALVGLSGNPNYDLSDEQAAAFAYQAADALLAERKKGGP